MACLSGTPILARQLVERTAYEGAGAPQPSLNQTLKILSGIIELLYISPLLSQKDRL
jgi:hypothetical protein